MYKLNLPVKFPKDYCQFLDLMPMLGKRDGRHMLIFLLNRSIFYAGAKLGKEEVLFVWGLMSCNSILGS